MSLRENRRDRWTTKLPCAIVFLLLVSTWGSALAVEQLGKKNPTNAHFLRLRENGQGELLSLDAAIVRYESTGTADRRIRVDLIAAVHVAEASFFAELNRLFPGYESVLYELVAPEDVRPNGETSQHSTGVISWMQGGIKSLLALEFQLDAIDYTQQNFVHADFTPEEFSREMRDRGESFVEILFRALGRSLATQSTSPVSTFEAEMIAALFASDRDLRLKRLLAQQLVNTDLGALWQGPDGSTIITERNKRALEVLQRELQSGKKRIAVFYGAGHTPDLHQRLVKDFGLKPVRTRWLTAWNLMADKGLNGK